MDDINSQALIIQKHYRGYLTRKKLIDHSIGYAMGFKNFQLLEKKNLDSDQMIGTSDSNPASLSNVIHKALPESINENSNSSISHSFKCMSKPIITCIVISKQTPIFSNKTKLISDDIESEIIYTQPEHCTEVLKAEQKILLSPILISLKSINAYQLAACKPLASLEVLNLFKDNLGVNNETREGTNSSKLDALSESEKENKLEEEKSEEIKNEASEKSFRHENKAKITESESNLKKTSTDSELNRKLASENDEKSAFLLNKSSKSSASRPENFLQSPHSVLKKGSAKEIKNEPSTLFNSLKSQESDSKITSINTKPNQSENSKLNTASSIPNIFELKKQAELFMLSPRPLKSKLKNRDFRISPKSKPIKRKKILSKPTNKNLANSPISNFHPSTYFSSPYSPSSNFLSSSPKNSNYKKYGFLSDLKKSPRKLNQVNSLKSIPKSLNLHLKIIEKQYSGKDVLQSLGSPGRSAKKAKEKLETLY